LYRGLPQASTPEEHAFLEKAGKAGNACLAGDRRLAAELFSQAYDEGRKLWDARF
jgi:hypothetical protein